ncbi:metallophosphoesterase family protein [Desulfospira joergensenii]|uniref:metallophosphoesterase family protein n=1 Tax=Desulfospira joergensenii TaxID=53329 RepID=UPI0003B4025D|nr:metallophosphoesterase [Desulfospira joergensenii]
MKIYAVADIHGKSGRIKAIRSVLDRFEPEIMVIAGDITHYLIPEKTIRRLDRLEIPILTIRGNSDLKRVEELVEESQNIRMLTPEPLNIKDLSFSGTGGALALPFASRICRKEEEILERLGRELSSSCPENILVVHPPPRGILDRVGNKFSAGSRNLKAFIEKFQPGILFCGHIHNQPGVQVLGRTMVVNCTMGRVGGGVVIEYEKEGPIRVTLLKPDGSNGMSTLFTL